MKRMTHASLLSVGVIMPWNSASGNMPRRVHGGGEVRTPPSATWEFTNVTSTDDAAPSQTFLPLGVIP